MELALFAMLILGVMQQSMACTYTPARQEVTVFGTKKYYCDYVVGGGNNTVKLSIIPGSRFRTSECSECHCTRNGLQCCGYGIRSANLVVPNECRVLPDGCEPRLVLKSDNKTECAAARPQIRPRPRLDQTMNPRIQTARIRPQPPHTPNNNVQPMSAVTRQINRQSSQGSQPTIRQIPGKQVPGHQGPRLGLPVNQAPGKQGPRQQIPGKPAPMRPSQGKPVSGPQAPKNPAPGGQAQNKPPTQIATKAPRPAQIVSTSAPAKPTNRPQPRRQPRPSHHNRSFRFNPFRNRQHLNEESMQLMQQMMLLQALSSGTAHPLQSLMLMNMFEM